VSRRVALGWLHQLGCLLEQRPELADRRLSYAVDLAVMAA
jgi:hypothetical protein